jgi:hypothetical protein
VGTVGIGCDIEYGRLFYRSDTDDPDANKPYYRTLAEAQVDVNNEGSGTWTIVERLFVCTSDPNYTRPYWEILFP